MRSVTVWYGRLPLLATDQCFREIVRVGQRYVDKHAQFLEARERGADRPDADEEEFRLAIGRLREMCSPEMSVLIDELDHRWQFPKDPSIYAFTSEVTSGVPLCIDSEPVAKPVVSVKVGEAARSLAPRLSRYVVGRRLQRGEVVDGTVELRLAGSDPATRWLKRAPCSGTQRHISPRLTAGPDPKAHLTAESFQPNASPRAPHVCFESRYYAEINGRRRVLWRRGDRRETTGTRQARAG